MDEQDQDESASESAGNPVSLYQGGCNVIGCRFPGKHLHPERAHVCPHPANQHGPEGCQAVENGKECSCAWTGQPFFVSASLAEHLRAEVNLIFGDSPPEVVDRAWNELATELVAFLRYNRLSFEKLRKFLGLDPFALWPVDGPRPTLDDVSPPDIEIDHGELAVQLVETLERWMEARLKRWQAGCMPIDTEVQAGYAAAGTYTDLGDGKGYGYPNSIADDHGIAGVPEYAALIKSRDEAISDAKGDVLDVLRALMAPTVLTKPAE